LAPYKSGIRSSGKLIKMLDRAEGQKGVEGCAAPSRGMKIVSEVAV
jgi:hypothetical protein